MGTYEATVSWRRGADERFIEGRYSRAHVWRFDGGASVHASASPHVVRPPYSDPAGVDPEEALVAALSSCHMLVFLHLAAQRGFAVASYADSAVGVMSKNEEGREWVSRVTLRPHVAFDGPRRPMQAELDALHRAAHEGCFIANSVRTTVVTQGSGEGLAPVGLQAPLELGARDP